MVPRSGTVDPADLARVGFLDARAGRCRGAVVDGLLSVLGGDGNGVVCRRVVDGFPEVEVGRMRWGSGCGRTGREGRAVGLRVRFGARV